MKRSQSLNRIQADNLTPLRTTPIHQLLKAQLLIQIMLVPHITKEIAILQAVISQHSSGQSQM